jgi:hypothetical protein
MTHERPCEEDQNSEQTRGQHGRQLQTFGTGVSVLDLVAEVPMKGRVR